MGADGSNSAASFPNGPLPIVSSDRTYWVGNGREKQNLVDGVHDGQVSVKKYQCLQFNIINRIPIRMCSMTFGRPPLIPNSYMESVLPSNIAFGLGKSAYGLSDATATNLAGSDLFLQTWCVTTSRTIHRDLNRHFAN